MKDIHLGEIESRFADIIWQNEPLASAELSALAEKALGWKKTTSYTVLKRLCDKGIFTNDKGTVKSIISREDFYSVKSEKFVDDTFGGSLPAFLAAFTRSKGLSAREVDEIRCLIDKYGENNND